MSIQVGSAFGKIQIDASGVTSGVNSAVKSMEGLKTKAAAVGQAMQQVGAAMTAAFTVPLVFAARSALHTFQEYEEAMNILGSVSGATADEMEKLAKLAKDLGADLTLPGTSAADAAQAMAELAKAGLNVNEIMAAAKGVLQMSAAGQLSNAEAAEITANALNAFKLSGEDAVRVADLLAAGANSSSASVKEMADSLQMSSAVFSSAGMKIEDLVTAISIMANYGIQGSDAGTSLKQMLLSLEAPSKDAAATMKRLGISIYDAAGVMLPMRDIIQMFSSKMENLTQKQRDSALAAIFGSDAVRAANIVLLGGADAYDKMYEAVNKTGAAADLATAMMKGLTGAMGNLKSAFETASIAAIEPFKEDIVVLLDYLAKALKAFAALPAPVRKFIVEFLAVMAVMGPILLFFGSLLSMLATIVTAFGTLGISVGAVATAVGTAGTAIVGFGAAAISALLPVILIIGAVIAVVYLLYKAWTTNFLGIQTATQRLWETIKRYFTMIVSYIRDVFQKVNWSAVGKFMMNGLSQGIISGMSMVIMAAVKVATAALAAIKSKLGIHSPSTEFMKLGAFSGQGFQLGLAHAMDPNAIARTMAKPVSSINNSQQQTVNMQFANGLTLRQARDMISQNNQVLFKQLARDLST